MVRMTWFTSVALCVVLMGTAHGASNASRPADLALDPPTIHCLSVQWYIGGDANEDARVDVEYRKSGDGTWHKGLSLFRTETAALKKKPPAGTTLFAGSIFDLEPETGYELRLTLTDPDGGNDQRLLNARTRGEPKAPKPVRVLHVVPGDGGGRGTEASPFRGLAQADKAARPGDLILVHKGVYPATFTVTKSGTPERPIIWRGAGDGEAIIEGGPRGGKRAPRGISVCEVHDVWFERLTVRGAQWGIVAHGSQRIVVRRCHLHKVEYGFTGTRNEPLTTDFFLADNVVEGPSTWPRTKGIENARGFQVSGLGHVVCYNRIRGFADGIDTFGSPECSAIDIYGNEISEMTDDGIEADYSQQNVRIFRNRLTNCFQGITEQPIFGGPVYIFRNAMYNIQVETFKMHNAPSGFLLLHNTSVKQGMPWVLWSGARVSNAVSRNNLFIGTRGNYAMEFTAPMVRCDFDYDGFGGGPFAQFAKWNNVRYDTFEDFRRKSPIEHHAVLVDATRLFASGVRQPRDVKVQFPVKVNDLRLSPRSRAVDAGEVLPNINDGYQGEAPDLGAYEAGEDLPHYGPRPE